MHEAQYSRAGVCSSQGIGRRPSLLKILKLLHYAGAAGAVGPRSWAGRGVEVGQVRWQRPRGGLNSPSKKLASSGCRLQTGC